MTGWDGDALARLDGTEELELASRLEDGALSAFTTMWVVRAHDAAYVRSARGPDGAWYRRALQYGVGRVRAGGVEQDVTFVPTPAHDMKMQLALDAAYHATYDQYGPTIVGTVVGPDAAAVTLRLEPIDR
jgi:hypothetical protein